MYPSLLYSAASNCKMACCRDLLLCTTAMFSNFQMSCCFIGVIWSIHSLFIHFSIYLSIYFIIMVEKYWYRRFVCMGICTVATNCNVTQIRNRLVSTTTAIERRFSGYLNWHSRTVYFFYPVNFLPAPNLLKIQLDFKLVSM